MGLVQFTTYAVDALSLLQLCAVFPRVARENGTQKIDEYLAAAGKNVPLWRRMTQLRKSYINRPARGGAVSSSASYTRSGRNSRPYTAARSPPAAGSVRASGAKS